MPRRRKDSPGQTGFTFLAPEGTTDTEQKQPVRFDDPKKKCLGPVCTGKDLNGVLKSIRDFPRLTKKSGRTWCKECEAQAKREKERGITEELFNRMHNFQDGVCAVCKQPEFKGDGDKKGYVSVPMKVDRDPDTKKVRGLLCSECKRKLYYFEWIISHPEWLEKAEGYRKGGK